MRIIHICLTGSYNDNWGYQDNIIPKYNIRDGHEVKIITNRFINSTKNDDYELVASGRYYLDNGIEIIRLPFKKYIPLLMNKKLRLYRGLYNTLIELKPDFLFIHGVQFLDIYEVIRYLKIHKHVKVVADNHSDFSNSARNWASKNILHQFIWRRCAQAIDPYTKKFYGVLPARVNFLTDIYKVPKSKTSLLVMGADDDIVKEAKKQSNIEEIRDKYHISKNDLLIVTGGKIDLAKKQTLLLMEAIMKIKDNKIRLVVFGSVVDELKEEFMSLVDGYKIQYAGWISSNESYKYFAASDLVVFPGRHSVFWEQVVGLGIPMIVKQWEGTTHIDIGGNCKFLRHDSVDEIYELVTRLINNKDELDKMREVAEAKGMKYFSYKDISSRAIEI